MTNEGKGRIFRRKDGKYLLYIPLKLAEDSMFPFPVGNEGSVKVKVSFKMDRSKRLLVEETKQDENNGKETN